MSETFLNKYLKHKSSMSRLVMCAKEFIIENYQKIDDWSDLDVEIEDASGDKFEYYKYNPKNKRLHRFFKEAEEERKLYENQVVSLTDVVLDSVDGDFSLTINGKDHMWIDDESVILIASYMEEKLKK